ncbi:MAG TPA: bifunctional helix-turn-helix transcriptional regulator/GNAT family N-acetyltransferase [Ramlibacter sp.]|uniref:bifunctional helix-turn-helix transcriptional regulator/GNAT family N-acetyltransferase n=1 Tax=Ramlibacter sp. TaxID=1917967 RepID=UPI002D2D1409|nr:bifunctional helix-turn-helix transcriptional regulator/GNAT family N-acetyltransferase [Ramlibacter sp.]HZY18559.1 bifunctional helix-turn-helix transcriptional regulator/GNAT family N-acetyltransferase [Ramlibacter sp.]
MPTVPAAPPVAAPTPAAAVPATHVRAVRGFNRFYTRRIGVLAPYLGGELSLAEVRVLYELAHRDQPTAGELARELGLDTGYLSRILRRFEARGWLERSTSPADARQSLLRLTDTGHQAFAPLQERSHREAEALLAPLAPHHRERAIGAMDTLQQLLGDRGAATARTVILRDPRPGDLGWVVQQHGEIYAREHGYTAEFEALVAEVAAGFLRRFDPAWEKGWIAELDGERVGSVFVMRKSATVAQLRLLILSAHARGLGLGGRLVDECIAFARDKGYRRMVLWTNGQLDAARAIYAARGFLLVQSEPMQAYGRQLVGETWELRLR